MQMRPKDSTSSLEISTSPRMSGELGVGPSWRRQRGGVLEPTVTDKHRGHRREPLPWDPAAGTGQVSTWGGCRRRATLGLRAAAAWVPMRGLGPVALPADGPVTLALRGGGRLCRVEARLPCRWLAGV